MYYISKFEFVTLLAIARSVTNNLLLYRVAIAIILAGIFYI